MTDNCPPNANDELRAELKTLTAERGRLREALSFYADKGNYSEDGAPGLSFKYWDNYYDAYEYDWSFDLGQRATAALEPHPDAQQPTPQGETTASGEGNEMNDDVPRVERPELLKAYNEGWELVKLRAAVTAYLEADEAYHNRDSRDPGVTYSAVVKARAELRRVLTTADASDDPPAGETTAAGDSYPAPDDPAVKPVPLEDRDGKDGG